uniref:Uncharacterized protein n=1 Tax=Anguilla anguilla TaxID=7936 RepID=A0A0E9TRB1_ANGAN
MRLQECFPSNNSAQWNGAPRLRFSAESFCRSFAVMYGFGFAYLINL